MKTTVYPTAANSLVLRHPIDGPLSVGGSQWEVDGFTCRMLADSAITSDPQQAWSAAPVSAPQQPAPAEPDAHD